VAQLSEQAAQDLDPVQATELVEVLDLEARWENQRADGSRTAGRGTLDLLSRQRTYEAFRVRMAAYLARYRTQRVPELTPNGPDRLRKWCRTVRAVLHRAGRGCPVHAIEKAHRLVGRIAERLKMDSLLRGAPPQTTTDAIRELDTLIRWCDQAGEQKPMFGVGV
jgi:hypothetical protein